MNEHKLNENQISDYRHYLLEEERSTGTIEKYMRDTRAFILWLNGRAVTKEISAEWKNHLIDEGYAPVTINAMLSSVNGLFNFLGWNECRVKFLKIQRQMFRDPKRELNKYEYERLIKTSRERGRERLSLLMETICATGIRVSEVKYITVEAAKQGKAEIMLKGKIRVIIISSKLCRKLLKYSSKQKNRLRRCIPYQKRK